MCVDLPPPFFQINNGYLWRRKGLWVICSSEGYTSCILRIPVKKGRIRRSHSECATCFSEMRQPRWRMQPSNATFGGRNLLNETQLLSCFAMPTDRFTWKLPRVRLHPNMQLRIMTKRLRHSLNKGFFLFFFSLFLKPLAKGFAAYNLMIGKSYKKVNF